jgi:hypothetical protein
MAVDIIVGVSVDISVDVGGTEVPVGVEVGVLVLQWAQMKVFLLTQMCLLE